MKLSSILFLLALSACSPKFHEGECIIDKETAYKITHVGRYSYLVYSFKESQVAKNVGPFSEFDSMSRIDCLHLDALTGPLDNLR